MASEALPGSFRDPSGFLFLREGVLYRQVNPAYGEDYEHLVRSGLYESLAADGHLVRHEEVSSDASTGAFRILQQTDSFVSYPYEWCFGQLKAAAELTLEIARKALGFGMCLKDASAYNIQFRGALPILIDTLSFRLVPGEPWVAYRQFCQHFLAPLAVMAHRDARLSQLLRVYIDGLPLDLASELLPARTRLSLWPPDAPAYARREPAAALNPTRRLRLPRGEWESTAWWPFSTASRARSPASPGKAPEGSGPTITITRTIPRGPARRRSGSSRQSFPRSPRRPSGTSARTPVSSARRRRRRARTRSRSITTPPRWNAITDAAFARKEPRILPLVLDLSNPSGGTGWANRERASLSERGPADLTLALALIHHLAIGNNVPFEKIAEFARRDGADTGDRVRAQGRLASAAHARDARGRLRRIHGRGLRAGLRAALSLDLEGSHPRERPDDLSDGAKDERTVIRRPCRNCIPSSSRSSRPFLWQPPTRRRYRCGTSGRRRRPVWRRRAFSGASCDQCSEAGRRPG